MKIRLFAIAVSLVAGIPTSQAVAGNAWWLDPAESHTNGIPTASSDPHRGPSVCWHCNPQQKGACGGAYFRPALGWAHAVSGTPRTGCACPACQRAWEGGPWNEFGTAADQSGGVSWEGVEPFAMSKLGQVAVPQLGDGAVGSSPLAAPPAGGLTLPSIGLPSLVPGS